MNVCLCIIDGYFAFACYSYCAPTHTRHSTRMYTDSAVFLLPFLQCARLFPYPPFYVVDGWRQRDRLCARLFQNAAKWSESALYVKKSFKRS